MAIQGVKPGDAVTGVLNGYQVASWFWEELQEIDSDWDADLAEAEEAARITATESGESEEGIETAVENAGYELGEMREVSSPLYGDWIKDPADGLWGPDTAGKYGFAAIYRRDSNTFQVVWSRHEVTANRCSPCYPGQGDLDTDGSDYVAYAFPPKYMSEEWLANHQDRYLDEADQTYTD